MDLSALSSLMSGGAGAAPNRGNNGPLDWQALQGMLGGMGNPLPAHQPVANPEETYASQLTQLQVRAFFCCRGRRHHSRILQDITVGSCKRHIISSPLLVTMQAKGLCNLQNLGYACANAKCANARCDHRLLNLQDMGFYNHQENIRVLQSTGGNVQAAVDRLLNQS